MKILYLSPYEPYPSIFGGAQRTQLLWEALTEFGEVDFVGLFAESRLPLDALAVLRERYNLKGLCPIVEDESSGLWWFSRFFKRFSYAVNEQQSASLQSVVDLDDYDLIVTRYTRTSAWAGDFADRNVILDVDDLLSEFYKSRARNMNESAVRRFLFRVLSWGHHCGELRALKQFRHLWFTKTADIPGAFKSKSSILQNVFLGETTASAALLKPDASNKTIVTLSRGGGTPNATGIMLFLRDAWGQVLEAVPDAQFKIYGSGITDAEHAEWGSYTNVEVVGFAESISEVYASARFSIAAIPFGSGTNIKVVESYGHHRACVTTTFGVRGFDALTETPCGELVADGIGDMVEKVVHLLNDHSACCDMARIGKEVVDEHYSPHSFKECVKETINQLLV